MSLESVVPPQQMYVTTEFHVIAMRQEVRQIARTLGFGLAEQAKIATAISTIARVLLARDQGAMFTLRPIGQGAEAALEVACALGRASADGVEPAQPLDLANIHLLVDEAAVSCDAGMSVLKICIRLRRAASS
jgi:hypothetical protein